MKRLLVVLMAVALVGAFTTTAMAADWSFYGNARMATFWYDDDPDTGEGDGDLSWDLQSNSRFGASIKANDAVSARYEIGTAADNIRRIYGVWNFGAGKMKIGQDYTPWKQFYSGQVFGGDAGLLNVGFAYGSRRPQIAVAFGDFEIALIDHATGLSDGGDIDTHLPKVEAALNLKGDGWFADLLAAYQIYNVEWAAMDEDITAWALGGGFGVDFGPAYIKFGINYGENKGVLGYWGSAAGSLVGGVLQDAEETEAGLVFGFKVTDALTFETGIGANVQSFDDGRADNDTAAWYAQSVIMIGPGVFLIPEVGVYDYETSDDFYLGAKWQINW